MFKKFIFIALIFSLLCGCWSAKELTDLAIVSAMGIEKSGDDYILTVQIVNPGDIAGKSQTTRVAVSTYSIKGRSIFEAIRKLSKLAPRKLYFAHLRLVVIGEELAKEGISEALELMSRDHEFRTDFYLLISKDFSPYDILNVLTPIEKNPSNKVFNTIEVSYKNWAPTAGVKLDELINKLTSKGDNPVLTGIFIEGDKSVAGSLSNVESIPSPANLMLENIAVFKKDQLVGWLGQEESKGYNYIADNVKNTVAVLDWKDGKITLEFSKSSTKITAITDSEQPKIIVDVFPEAQIGEVQANIDLTQESNMIEVEKIINERGRKVLGDVVKKAQNLQTDIFGFGDAIHRENPKIWKELEADWNEVVFPELDIEINFKTTIRRLGTTNDSFLNEMEDN
ncbi:Ger(x)C family spore germination protein [Metabacillus litoralis]|uniref:Ger(x)C family spore germination protein n=1 Tax=Metabacillus litoralis TaxID=152268 RepID=UPI001CFF0841|nr:Ger(x)C family spore germination protein [Metabacillus litoralis]